MNSKTLTRVGFVALLFVVVIGQLAWYLPQLPERVATHFGVDVDHPKIGRSEQSSTR